MKIEIQCTLYLIIFAYANDMRVFEMKKAHASLILRVYDIFINDISVQKK